MITAIAAQLIATFADSLRPCIAAAGAAETATAAGKAATEISVRSLIGNALGNRFKPGQQ